MRKLAIIGASYLQLPLVRKAKEMGLEVHCFAWEDGAVCKDEVDKFYPISIIEKEKILEICQAEAVDGICTIASDVAAPTVAFVAENMGLKGNSFQSATFANNKHLMRLAFQRASIPCPKFQMVKSIKEEISNDISFPMIVKPSDRSGSLGVSLAHSKNELEEAIQKAISFSFKKEAMVEEFVEGREISVEFISYEGKHYPLQITDKVTTGAPHFVELEHHQPADLSQEQFEMIYTLTSNALDSLGITNGASHSEFKIKDDGLIYAIEIGARMGGDFIGSDLVKLSTGYDFLKGVINVALGEFEKPMKTDTKHSGVYFLAKETAHIKNIIEHYQKFSEIIEAEITDNELHNVQCSADRSGYFLYQSERRMII